MAPVEIDALKVACVDGRELDVASLIKDAESATVLELRAAIASCLALHPMQCVLLLLGNELQDEEALADVLRLDGVESSGVTVMQEPCLIRPHQYEEYIDHEATGCLPVDRININWHPLDFGEREHRGFEHDYELVRKAKPKEDHGREYVEFPKPRGLKVNMMPFVMGKKASLPEELHHYWELIEACKLPRTELGKVGYLTIHESEVAEGNSQRRSGVHIEAPGYLAANSKWVEQRYNWGCGVVHYDRSWVEGGIYMASNVAESCRFWNVKIKKTEWAAGHLGDMEHMREVLGDGQTMEANRMYWLTDATPHESLPLEQAEYRQFFRLVTSKLSAWYPEHSTANELVKIDTELTKVIEGSKFVD